MNMMRIFVCAIGALGVSCSSSSTTSGPPSTDCGPGPYVKLTGTVLEASLSGAATPKEGVTITLSMCPDRSFTTDAQGVAVVNVTKSTPTLLRLEHPDDIPAYLGEWMTDVDFVGSAQIVPKVFESVVAPTLGPDTTLLALGVMIPGGATDAGTDPCTQPDGVTFAIPGHPEAQIAYFTTDAVPKPDTTMTATTSNGLATVTNLADGVTVTPTATKPGCTLTAAVNGFTGRAVAEKGYAVELFFRLTK
jgi:hypothetical protein